MVSIYKIKNQINEVYIGVSSNYGRRMREYGRLMCKDQPRLYNSLVKYGVNSHEFSIVHELPNDSSSSVRTNYEQTYINLYRSAGVSLLNIREAGATGKHAESTKKIMSEKRIANITPEYIDALRARSIGNKNWVGRKHKPETIEKMRKVGGSIRYLYGKTGAASPFSKKVINVKTGHIYGCVQEAADSIGMKMKSLQKRLSGYWKNTTTLKYL